MTIACAVFSYNRPEYLERVLRSLVRNEGVRDCDWFFFQDGGKNEEDWKKVRKCAGLLEGSNLEVNSKNVGIAKQKRKAHKLFNDYDRVVFFEDDMVVSKYYLRVIRQISEEFPGKVVDAGDYTILARYGKIQGQDSVKMTIPHATQGIDFSGVDFRSVASTGGQNPFYIYVNKDKGDETSQHAYVYSLDDKLYALDARGYNGVMKSFQTIDKSTPQVESGYSKGFARKLYLYTTSDDSNVVVKVNLDGTEYTLNSSADLVAYKPNVFNVGGKSFYTASVRLENNINNLYKIELEFEYKNQV